MKDFLNGIGKVFGKISDQIQGRIERLKNERIKLIDEKTNLESIRPVTTNNVRRIITINSRVSDIDKILANKASDG